MPAKIKPDFRKLLRKALFLSEQESRLFDKIPTTVLEGIFRHNFNGNMALAERVLFNRHGEVDRVDRGRLEQEKLNISGLGRAADTIAKAFSEKRKVLFVTDNDNDGSLAQAILIEFSKTLPKDYRDLIHVEYAMPLTKTRGLTREVVDLSFEARGWGVDENVVVVTADNGINNRIEAERILGKYPNSELIITDHHLPTPGMVVQENARTTVCNPKHKPTEYFKKKNISGANTLGVLLRQVFNKAVLPLSPRTEPTGEQQQALANIDEIGAWANLLDYANADIADMPVRPYTIEKALKLRPLLNVSNSMSNIVTGDFDDAALEDIAVASRGTGVDDTQGLTAEWIRQKIDEVKSLNVMSRKLLNLYHARNTQDAFGERDFYSMLANELSTTEDSYESINPNYIEQLRPVIFNLAAIDNKDIYLATMSDTMVQVFSTLRQREREILDGLRRVGLLREDRTPNSTILYPVDPSVTTVFNRRLLGKAYNQDNNGFLLILSSVDNNEARGSMRSLYPISKLLEDKSEIEESLGILVDFQGHEQAAGFFIKSVDGTPLNEQRISEFNRWMDDRVGEMKIAERINQMPTVEVDFASASLAQKVNAAVKANLAGMWGLPTIMRFSPNKADGVWITDPETTEQINLTDLVKRKSFGYQAIATDFHDGAIVVPVEILRAVVDSNYTKAIRLSYMDDGVFMASQVVDPESLPNLVSIKGGRRDQEILAEYYEKTYKTSNFMPLTRDDFRTSPYFRFNKHGKREFEMWESLMIHLLDQVGADVLAVVDTEGTGLGKAPKCFNIGGTNVKIAENSGKTLGAVEFGERYFRDNKGKEYLLAPDQMGAMAALEEGQDAPEGAMVLHKTSLSEGVSYRERFAFSGKEDSLERITNVKEEDGVVVYNRQIDGFAFSFLVNNHDFAITKEFEDLTGIGNWMVEKHGKPAASVDRQIVHYYETLRNAQGEPAKVIFQAHNMPYDRGVISANFQKLNQLIAENLSSDTAKLARQSKLAYDDTPVSSFDGILGIPAKAYFYDSPYSDYSLSTFLARVARGKGGVFPDTTAKILLRYTPETERFSIIDRVANREVQIDTTLEQLMLRKENGSLPNNAVKYSVERMSSRAMIRNILLLEKEDVVKVDLLPHEIPHKAALDLFQENYHFDSTPETNIVNFVASLYANESERALTEQVNLADVANRFLGANKAIQAKFHDGWIYEKVLQIYEPDAKNLKVPTDVVEQINYYTDLPSSKIRKVLQDVIRFKRHFGVHHALVHEQHNNIRQRSEDGQGLSDTAYEVVLPQSLGMMKFYNPYYQSVRPAVEAMIKANIEGSMVQTMMGEHYNNEIALDSYSMQQMTAFKRHGKTDLVQRAQNLSRHGEQEGGLPAPIKFKLSHDILPPASAIYATPRVHPSPEQVRKDAEMLEFILVNEQMKSAAKTGAGAHYGDMILEIASANDAQAKAYRDDLLQRYSYIEFSRKESQLKKMLDLVKDVFAGGNVSIPPSLDTSMHMREIGCQMIDDMKEIMDRVGVKSSAINVEILRGRLSDPSDDLGAGRKRGKAKKEKDDGDEQEFGEDNVRQAHFLPTLEIERREPLKFAFGHYGVDYCFAYLQERKQEAALGEVESADVEEAAAPASARRRRP